MNKKLWIIFLVTLLVGCGTFNTENSLNDSNFPVGANILEIYNSKRPFILWEFNGTCYMTSARFSDLSGNVSTTDTKCPFIINPIKVIRKSI